MPLITKKKQPKCGFLILGRKGEYIEDTLDQRGNTVFGLQHQARFRLGKTGVGVAQKTAIGTNARVPPMRPGKRRTTGRILSGWSRKATWGVYPS
jgi:hypothetical protein